MKIKSVIIVTLLLTVALSAACGGKKKQEAAAKDVLAGIVTKGTIERKVLFTGNIEAQDAVQVFSRANGKVSKKFLREGDPVKQGEGILLVDRDEIGYRFKPLIIDSPIDGFVGTILVDVGSYVYSRDQFNQNPVAVVVRPGNMRVKLDIPERYLEVIKVQTGVKMIVDSLEDETFDGTIITSSPVVDQKTRTARVEVSVPNINNRLRHGMFGRIYLVVEKKDDTLMVPYGAISWEGEKQFVYKIVDGAVVRTQIETGIRNDVHVEIVKGLVENERVVLGNLLDLKDGEKVIIKEAAIAPVSTPAESENSIPAASQQNGQN